MSKQPSHAGGSALTALVDPGLGSLLNLASYLAKPPFLNAQFLTAPHTGMLNHKH